MTKKEGDRQNSSSRKSIATLFYLLGIGWTILILSGAGYSYFYSKQNNLHLATLQAKTAFAKDITYRRWNSSKGGLYAPVTSSTPPNPYLEVKNRDIDNPVIGHMTLINPSYMTRQIHELEKKETGVRGHITSLTPIRPANKPDTWEQGALKEFEDGNIEYSSIEKIDGETYLRYMKALIAEESCLKCHAAQGYSQGDVRGGISISVPMKPLDALHNSFVINSSIIFLVIWLSGLIGILGAHKKIDLQLKREEEGTREKERLNARLVQAQKLEAIGHLAAGVAHEINTPIQYVQSNSSFLRESFDEIGDTISTLRQSANHHETEKVRLKAKILQLLHDLDWQYLEEEIPRAIKQSEEGLKHVTDIVIALKEFSHPGSKEKVPADLNGIIHNVVVVCQNEWKYVATMDTDLASDVPEIPLLVNEIRQVFLNLVNNAIQAITSKQEEMNDSEKGKIALSSRMVDGHVEVTVRDNGCGISKENLDHIFEPFFTTKEVGQGTGQGLSISYDIVVNKHGGTIKVESEEGGWTQFTLNFPLNATDEQQTS